MKWRSHFSERQTVFHLCVSTLFFMSFAHSKPNILFIAVDDLNDWIGVMGGHPQAITPNMDRLAERGVLFTNAHCQSPVCNPSRASLMSGLYPATTGIYFLNPEPSTSPLIDGDIMLPRRFEREGFHVAGAGKLYHGNQNGTYWANHAGLFGGVGPYPPDKLTTFPGHPLWDWGVYPERNDEMPDYKTADWAIDALGQTYENPFLMGVGFQRPHVPQYAPQEWFDLYPLQTLELPVVMENDIADVSDYGNGLTTLNHVSPSHEWVLENDEWKPLVQSYLACVSFVDAQLGRVLDALDASDHADSTYIVFWTDHGFHLGEKEHWAKRTLWQDGTRTPMIIAGPGIEQGGISNKPVQLLDMYPTMLELAGLDPDPVLEGNSLVPLLLDPEGADWPHMARTSFGPGNYSIVSERYRYIHYNDGTEEFYDNQEDPHEWNNLLRDPQYAEVVAEHRSHAPTEWHEVLGTNSTGHQAFEAAEALPDPEPYAGCLDSTQYGYNPMAGIHDPNMCRGVSVENDRGPVREGTYINVSESGANFNQRGPSVFIPITRNNIRELKLYSFSGNQMAFASVIEGEQISWQGNVPVAAGLYLIQVKGASKSFLSKVYLH